MKSIKFILASLAMIIISILNLDLLQVEAEKRSKIEIRMPDVRPDHADQYLCIAHRLPATQSGEYIVSFNPKASSKRVHHMLMYGCQLPGVFQRDSPNFVWDCSSMDMGTEDNNHIKSYQEGPICYGNQQIMYGWAMDAPALKLPHQVGFKVGGSTGVDFLVVQVHYGHMHEFMQSPSITDNSGLIINTVDNDSSSGISRQAGVLILTSYGFVNEGKARHEMWCKIQDDIVIHPFRFRVHTHKLGVKVLGAKLSPGKGQQDDSEIIGTESPKKPQMFYPVENRNLTLTNGDSVYAYCDFDNDKKHMVEIGQTGDDEMCNFYLMYWTDSPRLLSQNMCSTRNPRGLEALARLFV